MAVNLKPIKREQLVSIPGVELSVAAAGIKKFDRNDLLVMSLGKNSTVAGVFTKNYFSAAPVQICKKHLDSGVQIRALIVNSGNANAGNGAQGCLDTLQVCRTIARELDCLPEQILPFSTGVIFEPLPVEKITSALLRLQRADWLDAARAIMTTDTVPKAVSASLMLDGYQVSITGISKGSGMIHPNMATMLGFIATDAAVTRPILQQLVKEVSDVSFNCISVDGDTSTNDSFILISTGQSAAPLINSSRQASYQALKAGLMNVSMALAQAIVRDGEGATKFISIKVEGGGSFEESKSVAYAIACSPLVKTAFFASDPNLGRLLSAIGHAEIQDLEIDRLELYLDGVLVAVNGARNPLYQEEDGQRVMSQSEILVRVKLGRGSAEATVWTCDFSFDYVKINASYRT